MPSKARVAFDRNAQDIKRLLEIHTHLGGDEPGRRFRLEVLNKSAIVLISAIWEAYCEDIAAEALEHLVIHAANADALPKELKKRIAGELKGDQNELAVWKISGSGWKDVLRSRLASLAEERNRRLNTPKAASIDELFLVAIGLTDVSTSWKWNNMTVDKARSKLDKFVALRGAIAHRGTAASSVTKGEVENFFKHVSRLVRKTEGRVNGFVRSATGTALWVRSSNIRIQAPVGVRARSGRKAAALAHRA